MLKQVQHDVNIKNRTLKKQIMKKSPTELINLTFSGMMILLTLAGAIVFLFTDLLNDRAFGNKRIILGIVFLTYAVYRSYRVYIVFKNKDKVI